MQGVEIGGRKSALFQSKMGNPQGKQAKEQALMMSNWREAAVFLSYQPEGVRAFSIDDVLSEEQNLGTSFEEFFLDSYLACEVGDSDLRYDAKARILYWRDELGTEVGIKFRIPQRLRVSIISPLQSSPSTVVIKPEEIIDHRMDSSSVDRLGIKDHFSSADLKKAHRKALMLYHPDHASNLSDEFLRIMNRRSAEFIAAHADLNKKT